MSTEETVPFVPGPSDSVPVTAVEQATVVEDVPVPPPAALTPEMLASMPDPEEIMRQAEIEAAEAAQRARLRVHNAKIDAAREEKLARRRAKRAAAGRATQGDLNAARVGPGLNRERARARG